MIFAFTPCCSAVLLIILLCCSWECFGDSKEDTWPVLLYWAGRNPSGSSKCVSFNRNFMEWCWISELHRVQEMPAVSVADWVHQLIVTCLCLCKQVLRMPWEKWAVGEIQRSFICGGGPLRKIAECQRGKVFSLNLCSIRISWNIWEV